MVFVVPRSTDMYSIERRVVSNFHLVVFNFSPGSVFSVVLEVSSVIREAPDTFKFLRHVTRAVWSVLPKCSHRCVSPKETPLKAVQIPKHTTKNSAEQTVMRTKWFKHMAI